MSTDNGGPAFPARPHEQLLGGEIISTNEGMTLRDYFAAKAMASLICEPPFGDGNPTVFAWTKTDVVEGVDRFALAAYRMADAMLRARKEPK